MSWVSKRIIYTPDQEEHKCLKHLDAAKDMVGSIALCQCGRHFVARQNGIYFNGAMHYAWVPIRWWHFSHRRIIKRIRELHR